MIPYGIITPGLFSYRKLKDENSKNLLKIDNIRIGQMPLISRNLIPLLIKYLNTFVLNPMVYEDFGFWHEICYKYKTVILLAELGK